MIIYANSIVIDEYGDVLLVKLPSENSHRPPGRPVQAAELPTDTAVDSVRSTTGLISMAVRLAGLTFWPGKPAGYLFLNLRCILRGGSLEPPDGIRAGMFKLANLPAPVDRLFEQQLQATVGHKGGAPFLTTYEPALLERLRGVWSGASADAQTWQTAVSVIARNAAGDVLWLQDQDGWRLPGNWSDTSEPPWVTAVGAAPVQALTRLSGIYPATDRPEMHFAFVAAGPTAVPPAAAYFAPGAEPANAAPQHVARVADAFAPDYSVAFRLETPAQGAASV